MLAPIAANRQPDQLKLLSCGERIERGTKFIRRLMRRTVDLAMDGRLEAVLESRPLR